MRSTFIIATALMVGSVTPSLAATRHHNAASVPSSLAGARNQSSTPSLAAERNSNPTPNYNNCETMSVQRGAIAGQGSGSNPYTQHNAFMKQCLEGKIPQ